MVQKLNEGHIAVVKELREQGLEIPEVGEQLGVSKSCVSRFLKRYNVEFDEDKHYINKNKRKWVGTTLEGIEILDVVDRIKYPSGSIRYRLCCKCSCGTTFETYLNDLQSGHTKSCGCFRFRKGKQSPISRYVGDLPLSKWSNTLRGAKQRGYLVEITHEDAWELFEKQEGKCTLTGIPLNLDPEKGEVNASLDRIDNSLGYIPGNVQWLHNDINQIKFTYDQDYFIDLCRRVANHKK